MSVNLHGQASASLRARISTSRVLPAGDNSPSVPPRRSSASSLDESRFICFRFRKEGSFSGKSSLGLFFPHRDRKRWEVTLMPLGGLPSYCSSKTDIIILSSFRRHQIAQDGLRCSGGSSVVSAPPAWHVVFCRWYNQSDVGCNSRCSEVHSR